MHPDLQQLLALSVLPAAGWLSGYIGHRRGGRRSVLLRPPRWVAWLCGNPRGDGTIDLGHGGIQLAGLVPLIAWFISLALGVGFKQRVFVFFLAFMVAIFALMVLTEWANWRERKRLKGK